MSTIIDGLGGLNRPDGTDKLIAAFGPDLVDAENNTGYSQNITSGNRAEFVQYLDNLFFQNYKDKPRNFDGTDWKFNLSTKLPMAKYWKVYDNRLYYASFKIPISDSETWDRDPLSSTIDDFDVTFPSRVGFMDLPLSKTKVKSGLFWSGRLKTVADNDNKLFITEPIIDNGFIDAGIKVGDPISILSGDSESLGEYTVQSVNANNQLTTLETIPKILTTASGWIGSNWFEVDTDDGDFLTGLGENNNRLLAFKRYSLHRYDGRSRIKVKGVPGTTSHRSIQNVKDKFTIYFHGSLGNKTGFYMYDGVSAKKISNPLEKHIKGISAAFYGSIAAWTEGNLYRAYVGTITNNNHGISVANAVWTFDIETGVQTIDPINKSIKASTQLEQSGQLNTFIGDTDSSVFKTGTEDVYDYDDEPINFDAETRVVYPRGSEAVNTFTRVEVIARNAAGVKVSYKLYNKLNIVDDNWRPLGNIKYDKTEFLIPQPQREASGIQYRFSDSSTKEPDMLIEKISTFYRFEGIQDAQLPR